MTDTLIVSLINKPYFFLFETILVILLPLYIYYRYPQVNIFRWFFGIFQGTYLYFIFLKLNLPSPNINFDLNLETLYLMATTLIASGILVYAYVKKPRIFILPNPIIPHNLPSTPLLILYIIGSVPLQELLFRGLYLQRVMAVTNNTFVGVIYASFIFAIFHTPFRNKTLLVGTFLSGILWSYSLISNNNLLPAIVSHGIIGYIFLFISDRISRQNSHK